MFVRQHFSTSLFPISGGVSSLAGTEGAGS